MTEYEMLRSLVGSEMCIRDRVVLEVVALVVVVLVVVVVVAAVVVSFRPLVLFKTFL